jgi:methanol metabolism-related c-type cytochrome
MIGSADDTIMQPLDEPAAPDDRFVMTARSCRLRSERPGAAHGRGLAPVPAIRHNDLTAWPVRAAKAKNIVEAFVLRSVALSAALALAAAALSLSTPTVAQEEEEKPYSIVDGKVDKGTYNGYRRYHAACHTCHGPDGLGSSYAPNLTDSLKRLSYEDFTEVVINGRENVTQTAHNVMPAFGHVEDVALYIDDIYGYLKARADGALGRGRPQRQ